MAGKNLHEWIKSARGANEEKEMSFAPLSLWKENISRTFVVRKEHDTLTLQTLLGI